MIQTDSLRHSPTEPGNVMADSTNDTSGPDGIWYFSIGPSTGDLRENNELNQGDTEPDYRCTVTIEGAAGSLVSGSGNTDFIDSVTLGAGLAAPAVQAGRAGLLGVASRHYHVRRLRRPVRARGDPGRQAGHHALQRVRERVEQQLSRRPRRSSRL